MFAMKQEVTMTAPVRSAKKRVLQPSPQKGAVDFVALRRNAIQRFPKTLARLAE
jgi:hypothetical protein